MKRVDRIYKDKILKEKTIEELKGKVFAPLPLFETLPKELSMSLYMMGTTTNRGRVIDIYTKEDFDIVDKVLKLELGEYYEELHYNKDFESGVLTFYLKLDRYKNILTKFWGLNIYQHTLDSIE
jgi:hypothetical protein